jgi:ABC-type sugar transport system, periplasmic component
MLTVGLMAGCGNNESSNSTTTAQGTSEQAATTQATSAAPVTISVGASAGWIKDIDKSLADQFKAETGNTIEFLISPDDQYTNVLKAKFATGEGPDVYYCGGGIDLLTFLPDQHALDLSNEPWVSRLQDWAKNGGTYNGKLIGFNTWSVDSWAVLYNNTIFEQCGITAPPKNYQEFLDICEKIKAKGITPIYEPAKADWHLTNWIGTPGSLASKNNPDLIRKLNENQAKLADVKELETALTQVKEMADKGYFGKDYMANTWEASIDNMGSGKYAMMNTYTSFQLEVLAKYPDSKADTWKMFPVPLADNTLVAFTPGGAYRLINKDSKYIDTAKTYFNFLAKPENLKAFYEARKDLSNPSFKEIEGTTTEGYKSLVSSGTGGSAVDFNNAVMYISGLSYGKYMQELLLNGKTPKQVLEMMDTERAKMYK